MDAQGWQQLRPWLAKRLEMPAGPLLCVIDGPARLLPGLHRAHRSSKRSAEIVMHSHGPQGRRVTAIWSGRTSGDQFDPDQAVRQTASTPRQYERYGFECSRYDRPRLSRK
jgi:hypothetical protein